MRARYQCHSEPGAFTYGSPGTSQPPRQRCVEITQRHLVGGGTTMRGLVRPLKHLGIFSAVVPRTGFEHTDLCTSVRQDVSSNATSGSGTDDHHVVVLLRFSRHSHGTFSQ